MHRHRLLPWQKHTQRPLSHDRECFKVHAQLQLSHSTLPAAHRPPWMGWRPWTWGVDVAPSMALATISAELLAPTSRQACQQHDAAAAAAEEFQGQFPGHPANMLCGPSGAAGTKFTTLATLPRGAAGARHCPASDNPGSPSACWSRTVCRGTRVIGGGLSQVHCNNINLSRQRTASIFRLSGVSGVTGNGQGMV